MVPEGRNSNRKVTVNLIVTALVTEILHSIATPAFALGGDYVPVFKDMKQIYQLGASLDNLEKKVSNPDSFEAALEGIRAFNRDKSFYPGYARNFVGKTVKNNAEGDPKVGYVREATNVISSLQELLEGREGSTGAEASKEAVKRVKKAEQLISRFLKESGVEDEKVAGYVKAHP